MKAFVLYRNCTKQYCTEGFAFRPDQNADLCYQRTITSIILLRRVQTAKVYWKNSRDFEKTAAANLSVQRHPRVGLSSPVLLSRWMVILISSS